MFFYYYLCIFVALLGSRPMHFIGPILGPKPRPFRRFEAHKGSKHAARPSRPKPRPFPARPFSREPNRGPLILCMASFPLWSSRQNRKWGKIWEETACLACTLLLPDIMRGSPLAHPACLLQVTFRDHAFSCFPVWDSSHANVPIASSRNHAKTATTCTSSHTSMTLCNLPAFFSFLFLQVASV